MDFVNDISFLKSKLKLVESEKEKLQAKLSQYKQENLELRTQLLTLNAAKAAESHHHHYHDSYKSNSGAEIEQLKKIIQDLIKANDEKVRSVSRTILSHLLNFEF